MNEALDWKKVVEGLTTRVNVLEKKLAELEARADKSDAYMEVASKIAALNHGLRNGR